MVVCKSCSSDRCGNHAACARKKAQARNQEIERKAQLAVEWAVFMGGIYVDMRSKNRLPAKEEEAELLYLRKHEPVIWEVLQEIGRRRMDDAIQAAFVRLFLR